MKLTKLHIFIIILIALILCPTLGACSVEGYVQRYGTNPTQNTATQQKPHYSRYGGSDGFDSNLDNQTISSSQNDQYYSSIPVSGSSSTPPGKAPSKAPGIIDKLKAIISSKPNTATTTVTPSSNSSSNPWIKYLHQQNNNNNNWWNNPW